MAKPTDLTVLTPLADRRWTNPHMPTDWQAFILRMYDRITPAKIASILGTTADTVIRATEEMGIRDRPADMETERQWMSKGYVTLIRDSWHLLDFGQLCSLTGMNEEELAYTIKEDDFLYVKLGGFKPDVPKLRYAPLNMEQREKTAVLRNRMSEITSVLKPVTVPPFGFDRIFSRFSEIKAQGGRNRNIRLAYSYCALYGDTFASDFDYGFSDEMLDAYRKFGVSGIWCQAVLYRIAPYPFLPALSEGWEARLDGMRRLTERLAKHGLKLWLYLNEPRALPTEYFADGAHDDIKGHTVGALTSLCTSSRPVRDYLYDTAAFLAEKVPLLGGFMTISGSENLTHCCSHTTHPEDCPRCSGKDYAEVTADCNNLLYRGAASVNPSFDMIAWTWGWPDDRVAEVAQKLDQRIILSEVSEHGKEKVLGGVRTSVNDYSISVVGPGEHALGTWKKAKDAGRRICAKTQLNTSWECSSVPMLPVFDTVAKHLCNLRRAGVEHIILDWTVGGYPSPTFALAELIMERGIDDAKTALDEFYARLIPQEHHVAVRDAVSDFCAAFDSWPFHIGVLYCGPQQMGPATPLRLEPSGMRATMTCWPYDDIDSWRVIYPLDIFESLTKTLSEKWGAGLEKLSKVAAENGVIGDIKDCAEAAYCCFRAMFLQTRFNHLRGDVAAHRDELISLAEEEKSLALRLADVQAHDPCIGFESTNHYFYTRSSLIEAALSCDAVLSTLQR